MTWQTALSDAMSAGDVEAAVTVVVDEMLSEQRRALAGRPAALTIRGSLRDGDLVFEIAGPRGRSWQVSRPLADLVDRARSYPDIALSLLSAVAASVVGKDRWGEEEWLPYGYVGAGLPPDVHVPDYVQTERDVKITAALDNDCDVLVIGRPASGKTVSAAEAARLRRVWHDDGIVWLDLTDPFDNAETVILALLTSARHQRYLAVVDNLQANVSATLEVFDRIERLRDELDLSIRILATCWSSAARLVEILPIPFTRIAADGSQVVHRLLADQPGAEAAAGEFDGLAGGDVVLAKTAMDHFRLHGTIPRPEEIADAVVTRLRADRLVDKEARRALYWFACLGEFEIGVYRRYCAEEYPGWPIPELRRRGLIRLDDEMYTVGHPSTAAALVRYATARWNDPDDPYRDPSRLAFEYLRRAGNAAVQAVLEKLDLVNHGYAANRGDRVLAKVWPQRGVLARFLRDQALVRDCTWGDNPASATFAAVALALLDQRAAWERTAEYVRGQWSYDATLELPRHRGHTPAADADDFLLIRQAMREQDESLGPGGRHSWQSADDVDLDRFHRTWMLGLLLTFENTAVKPDDERKRKRAKEWADALVRISDHAQQPNGAFYPERVPWITARVLNGLWHGGLDYDGSTMVKKACDWLRRSVDAGGPFDGRWHSGTGTWNSDVTTTAMCITALRHAGIRTDDHCVRAGYEYLKQQMPEWRRPGRELECAAAAEAMMLVSPDRREIYPVVVDLLEWVGRGEAETAAGREESVKIPFIAEQVVWIIQRIVELELETLLRDFEAPLAASRAAVRDPVSAAAPAAPAGSPAGLRFETADDDGSAVTANGSTLLDAETCRRAVDRMTRLARVIEANITGREPALRSRHSVGGRRPIEEQLEIWNARKRHHDRLVALIAAGPFTRELAAQIDALAREIFQVYDPLVTPAQ